jgi:hypothetical protein
MNAQRQSMKNAVWAMAALRLASCGGKIDLEPTDNGPALIETILDGNAKLECELKCSGTFGSQRRELALREAKEDWTGLAVLVVKIGYDQDLARISHGTIWGAPPKGWSRTSGDEVLPHRLQPGCTQGQPL